LPWALSGAALTIPYASDQTITSEACATIKTETVAIMTAIKSSHGCHVFLEPTIRVTHRTTAITSAWMTMLQVFTPAPTRN
jgi:hypothetical protein